MSEKKPVVLVPACSRQLGEHPFQVAGRKYLDFVRLASCLPLVVPGAADDEIDELLDLADGLLLTGSASNVHPVHFGEAVHDERLPLDPERDAMTLALIPKALARGLPLFAICRGAQETNVALGGSLHQAVQELPGHSDHRAEPGASAERQYGPAHAVTVQTGGRLEALLDEREFAVNSVHGQAVNRLAVGARVEALAADGVIEAFSLPAAAGFNLCVQWHPEWQAAGNPISIKLAQAFGQACRNYRDRPR